MLIARKMENSQIRIKFVYRNTKTETNIHTQKSAKNALKSNRGNNLNMKNCSQKKTKPDNHINNILPRIIRVFMFTIPHKCTSCTHTKTVEQNDKSAAAKLHRPIKLAQCPARIMLSMSGNCAARVIGLCACIVHYTSDVNLCNEI